MTLRRRTNIILALAAIIAVGLWIFLPSNKAKRQAERLRRELKAEGFKTELSEFNFAVPAEVKNRAEVLIAAGEAVKDVIPNRGMGFFRPVGSNAAIVLAKEERLSMEYSDDYWSGLRATLEMHKAALDAACSATMARPIRFEPSQGPDGDLLLPYLANVSSLAAALTARTLLELHGGHSPEAWTNLMALTRLATAWETEPVEVEYRVKFYCVMCATRATWEAAQTHALTERGIGEVLNEWERFDALKALPETSEFSCTSILRMCEAERQQPAGSGPGMRQAIGDFFDSPGRGWSEMTSGWRGARYRKYGAYEDETATMEFYRQRKKALTKATNGIAWAELRLLEGVTNQLGLEQSGLSRLGTFANPGPKGMGTGGGGLMRQRSLASRAAEAETRRRLVCTALALERFYLSHGSYPKALNELAPAFVPPVDYMDGKPLRYRLFDETNFLIYSTGLDCVDDGGIMQVQTNQFGGFGRGFFRAEEPDMLWPRAATPEEAEAERDRREVARRDRAARR